MPDTAGLIVGLMSITARILIYRHADSLSDGNVGGD